MYKCLYAVLCGRPSGPLVENDEGHFVPALGASEPEVPIGPTFLSLLQTRRGDHSLGHRQHPYTQGSFTHHKPSFPLLTYVKGRATDTRQSGTLQSLVIRLQGARLRQGLGHRYSATWNASTLCSCLYVYIYRYLVGTFPALEPTLDLGPSSRSLLQLAFFYSTLKV